MDERLLCSACCSTGFWSSSFFEGVTQWTLGEAFFTPGTEATAKIDLTYTEPSQPPVSWTDTLVFKQRDNAWLLNDIRMGGHRDAHPAGLGPGLDHHRPAWFRVLAGVVDQVE